MTIKNISLVGFMGSGKSTIGKILARKMGFFFVDTDKIIEYITGKKIKQIFIENGEPYFRNVESDVIKKLYENNQNCVFACGGGAFLNSKNIDVIRKNSLVLFLDINAEEAYKRLRKSKNRPLLKTTGDFRLKIEQLLKSRLKTYCENSDIRLKVDSKKPEYFAEELFKKIFDKKINKIKKFVDYEDNQNRSRNI